MAPDLPAAVAGLHIEVTRLIMALTGLKDPIPKEAAIVQEASGRHKLVELHVDTVSINRAEDLMIN